jgi:secretion/DNA translocation related TadE-like protein
MIAVVLSVAGAGAYLGSVVVARHRAQAAADLAALAAAARLPSGVAAACARATAVACGMGIDGAGCRVDGLDVVITVRVPVAFVGAAQATARAGPVANYPSRHAAASSAVVLAVGQIRVGEFFVGGPSQRHQACERTGFEFYPVDRDVHRHPGATVAGEA